MDRRRTEPLFNPEKWSDENILLVGAGSIGSKVAVELACLGVRNVTVYDDDKVEGHNLSNQAYRFKDVGKYKVDALWDIITEKTGEIPKGWVKKPHRFTLRSPNNFHRILSAVDTRDAREIILDSARVHGTKRVIDPRMDVLTGSLHTYNPHNQSMVDYYREHLPSEDIVGELTACGLPINCGINSGMLATLVIATFLNDHETEALGSTSMSYSLRAMEVFSIPEQ